ncbi:pantoate--beta-alanine ligase [Aliifodinibius sp. S!AR15-10]|uniref:pantoate--beta-alanine ligase n=1 Tax=Aliifodinibius sp. S!AR15-10 TaxID=2950437 RepID=UPI0028568D90|nr:pantoate--beta-alanine ligase [Aliifodinibius sp. S!AR15-10]MDR8391988.1 pantoate--beta-alanine ligase [Aliifodinibius sp. S!AR15-10]
MEAINSIEEIRNRLRSLKEQGKTVGFVPTMGALHEGHLSLIRIAKEMADAVVVSIYVNPEQFGPDEDYDQYPRQLESDLEICREEGVEAVFAPSDEIMYTDKKFIRIEVDELKDHMDGASRPGFYEGILLVVNKLFNIIEPDVAVFGQKDIQQYRILERMALEMNHGVDMVMAPIKRANDGLALSSRNAYLSEEERLQAPALFRSLRYVEKQIKDGVTTPKLLIDHQKSELQAKGFKIDYFNVFTLEEMAPVEKLTEGQTYIIAGAVYLGTTRLIDNLIIEF